MSEPIQAISQGNYILQGTVATSAGIVGDGTSQNPLRADETVLWSGTPVGSTSGNYITLTENASGFESIKVVAGNSDCTWSTISEFPGVASRWEFERIARDNTNYTIIDAAGLYRDSTDALKWVSRGGSRLQFNSNNTIGYQSTLTSMYVFKVVGINRIGNS